MSRPVLLTEIEVGGVKFVARLPEPITSLKLTAYNKRIFAVTDAGVFELKNKEIIKVS